MDALSVLRDFTARSDLVNVHRVGDEFRFGDDYRFPCSTETGYRSKLGFFYTLDSLVFFVKSSNLKHSEYIKQARALKLQIVTFTDKKPLLDYLEGKVSSSDAVELVPPLASSSASLASSAAEKLSPSTLAAADEAGLIHPSKRARGGEQEPMDGCLMIELVRSLERPVRDRETILLCPNKSFEGILGRRERVEAPPPAPPPPNPSQQTSRREEKLVKAEADLKSGAGGGGGGSDKRAAAAPPSSGSQQQVRLSSKARIEGPPIILVPNASQTLLNTFNAKEFLEDGVYVVADAKGKAAAAKKSEPLLVYRKIGREIPVKYEVRDKPTALSSKDWERVVAVFVLGKEWQFKDWPFKDHVDIFNKILGVYLRFEDDSMESVKVVTQWNVKIISLSKHKRHQDRTAVLEFWDKLEAFVRARRLPITF